MPLVIMCGYPSSGKSKRSNQLQSFIESSTDKKCLIINDDSFGTDKNDVYADSKKEKDARGKLKSSTQRLLSKDDLVILDSLNYIKGFRYELYCAVKSSQTPHCVIFCDTPVEVATTWNSEREDQEKYTKEIFDGLVMRFEAPVSKNRWDSPLFSIAPSDELPCQEIYDALFLRKAPPRNLSTVSQPLSATNFLYELDKRTQEAVTTLMSAQKTSIPGDDISIPGAKDKVHLARSINNAELQRIRRQFITYTKLHAIEDISMLANMFVQYINNSIK
ncbi:protein KTI12 homolog [Strongylocentrotus purpuratus]|uniref:Protein KTI12 homolog n=1 Tax=Strongylocentrotus purpuratus TaxID=7668 RepID=A0A7M7PVI4_STRPU|nr:protein KTI12 homolog [Strongylocentrotus purpuratus]